MNNFVYVKDCQNEEPIYSATIRLWKELSTNNYWCTGSSGFNSTVDVAPTGTYCEN